MTKRFKDFLLKGVVGPVTVGVSRSELLEVLGEPADWLGKPPCIGSECETFEESDAWIYYDRCISFFHEEARIMFNLRDYRSENPFEMEPCVWTVADIGAWLEEEGIPYSIAQEGNADDGGGIYLFGAGFLFVFFGFKRGREVPFLDKECWSVMVYANADGFKDDLENMQILSARSVAERSAELAVPPWLRSFIQPRSER